MFDTNIQYVIVTLHTRCTSVNVTRTFPIQVWHQYFRYVQNEPRTRIGYRKKKYGDISFFLRFQINNMYTFLHKRKTQLSIEQFFFKICKMYTFDQYVGLEITNSYTTKQWIIFWISTFCVNCVCNDILLMDTTYRPSIFSVLLQLKQYETSQNCWPRWVCSTSFFEKTSTATHCFY